MYRECLMCYFIDEIIKIIGGTANGKNNKRERVWRNAKVRDILTNEQEEKKSVNSF